MKRLSLVLVLLFSTIPLSAQNNCGNAYWANSLRCQIAGAAAIPQPNIATPPAVAADVKPFTRVFLMQDLSVRCLDGTRPVIYVDEAVSGNSDNWIISFTGGGATHPVDTNADGIPDDAQDAVDTYLTPAEADEMGTSAKPAMKNLTGVNSADAALNPVFSDYNRVRVEKCSYDRYLGRTSWQAAGGFYAGLNGGLNHIATPFMFREDFSDPNTEHLNGGSAHTVYWGDEDFYAHCPAATQCLPILDAAEFRARLEEQFDAMLDYSQTDSELATGADPSLGAGNFPTFYAWMPDCGTHAGAYNNDSFFDTDITYLANTYSMSTWLQGFMSVGRTNLRGWRIDGWTDSGANTMTTTCP